MNTTVFQLEQAVEQPEIYTSVLNIVFVALITVIFDKVFSERQGNGKTIVWKDKGNDNQIYRRKWIKILRNYESVERSYQELERITYTKKVDLFLRTETKSAVIGLVLALISFIVVFEILPEIISLLFPFNYSTFGILITCVNFLPATYLINKCKEKPEIKSVEEFVETDKRLDEKFTSMRNFFIYFNYIVWLTIYDSVKNQINILWNKNFIILVIFWSLALILGILTYKLVKQWKGESINCLKKIINKSYSDEFPYVVTNIPNIEGQLKDVFNEDFLVLDGKGIEKMTFWSSIKYMHTKEVKNSLKYEMNPTRK